MATYKPFAEESIYDVAVKLYGDLTLGLAELLRLNSVNVTDSLPQIKYETGKTRVPDRTPVPILVSAYAEYETRFLQSVYDIALQLDGNLNRLGDYIRQGLPLKEAVPSTKVKYIPGNELPFVVTSGYLRLPTDVYGAVTETTLAGAGSDSDSAIGTESTILTEDGFSFGLEDGSGNILVEN